MSRRETTVKVVMRKGNMSGRRQGLVLTLEEPLAKEWIARGWCDKVETRKPEPPPLVPDPAQAERR